MAICSECGGEVPIPQSVEIGEIVECPDCGIELEVITTNPLKLQPAPKEEEDWGE